MITAILSAFLLVSPVQAAASPQTPSSALADAEQLFEKREDEKALAAYDRAIAEDKQSAAAHLGRCRTLARLRRHVEAVPSCSEAVRLRPDDPIPLRWRGHFYISLRQFGKAQADLERAVTLTRDNYDIYYHLALAHYLQGNFAAAAEAYDGCMRTAKDDDSVIACAAWQYPALARAGKSDAAAKVLERIIPALQAKENVAYLNRLLLFKGLKSEDEVAATRMKETLAIPTVSYGVGLWHLLNDRREMAIEYFEQTMEGPYSTAFGRIAGEQELRRLNRALAAPGKGISIQRKNCKLARVIDVVDQQPVYRVACGVTAPKKISGSQPTYTDVARAKKVNGVVLISALVKADGTLDRLTIQRSLEPTLDQQALEAYQKWRFEPAKLNGRPIAVNVVLEATFRIY